MMVLELCCLSMKMIEVQKKDDGIETRLIISV